MENFYEVLGINNDATNEEIIKAYKDKAKIYHPDKNNGVPAAEAMFKLIGLAKDTLLDSQKRSDHDQRYGFKKKPTPQPKIIVKKETNINQIVGWGLLALLIGLAVGGSSNKSA